MPEEFDKTNLSNRYNVYDLSGDYGILYDSKGRECWFDIEDFSKIKPYYWNDRSNGYFYSSKNKFHEGIHIYRLIMDCPDNMEVDHIYSKPYDNRKSQLRVCTHLDNSRNRATHKGNKTSGRKGVFWCEGNKTPWRAYIDVLGTKIYLGSYNDLSDAIKARREGELKYFGDVAVKGVLADERAE